MEMRIVIFQSSLLFSFTFEKTKWFRKISWKLGAGWMTCSVALVYLTTGPRLIGRWGERNGRCILYSSFTHHHTLPDALCFVGPTKRAEDWDNKLSLPPSILWFFFFSCPLEISFFVERINIFHNSLHDTLCSTSKDSQKGHNNFSCFLLISQQQKQEKERNNSKEYK